MTSPSSTASPRSGVRALAAVTAALFALRLGWILREPDLDSDAYGHFAAAHKLASDPWNLGHHWVWRPLHHYLLAGFVRLHLPFAAVRIFASFALMSRQAATDGETFRALERDLDARPR